LEPARWERVKAIFQEAFEREPSHQGAVLDAACRGDAELREAVERLLRAHADVAGPLDAPPAIDVDPMESDNGRALPLAPSRIGPYRIVRELGRGGMGTVYLAERDEPGLRKTVAVKVVRRGMDSAFVVSRFRTERQILAALEHPGIARLYDGGTTDDGLPYFVMEYVDGEDLLRYCDGRRLPIATRLQLFVRVCEAVQYAHQSLVVHRDLKPSNVLVTTAGDPKLLDFGIAKLLSPQLGEEGADETASVIRLMTPHYASPEQVRGERVTTASDAYSLGVILYELLCGHRPYRIKRGEQGEIERAIFEQDVDPPSTALARTEKVTAPDGRGTASVTPADVSARRQSAPGKLRRRLRGDLDNVVLKALRKDRAERYATAAELGEDIRRHLEGFPVRARAARRAYRAAKFLRRHRTGVAATAAVVLSLVTGLGVAVHQARVARAALADSLLSQARFQRATGRIGHRFETLDLLERAAASVRQADASDSRWVALRTEAAGALALADLRIIARWPVFVGHYETEIDFTRNLERYVTAAPEGGFTIFATADRHALRHFPGAANNPAIRFRFSPDERWLAATFQDGHAEVHSLMVNTPPRQWRGTIVARTLVEFSPDNRAAVVSVSGAGALWHELTDGTERELFSEADRPEGMAFDPTGRLLAISHGRRCEVWRVPEGEKLWSKTLSHRISELAWSPEGRHLAASYDGRDSHRQGKAEFGIWLLDAGNGDIEAGFTDHEQAAARLAFHPAGGAFMSVGWERRLVWRTSQLDGFRVVGDASTLALRFSADGRRVAFSPTHEELALAEVAPPAVFREWHAAESPSESVFGPAVSPDGALLATAVQSRIHLWETAAGEEMSVQQLPRNAWWITLFFHPDGRSLVYSADSFGVMQAELRKLSKSDERRPKFQLAPARRISPGPGFLALGFAPDGRSLLVAESRRQTNNDRVPPTVWLWPDMDPARARRLAGDFPLVGYRLVAGGRWGVSTDLVGPDLWIWSPETGQRVRSLGILRNVDSMSSRDTRWLITGTRDEFALWDTLAWRRVTRWPARANQHFGVPGQFSRDARLFAVPDITGQVEIRMLPEGRELVSLPPPQPMRLRDFTFSAAGDHLYLLRVDGRVHEWNLAQVHRELSKLGLDWQ
jgi:serine/threonine protein kinase/WD40 repeat protein